MNFFSFPFHPKDKVDELESGKAQDDDGDIQLADTCI